MSLRTIYGNVGSIGSHRKLREECGYHRHLISDVVESGTVDSVVLGKKSISCSAMREELSG